MRLEVTPARVRLEGRDARQQLIVTGHRSDGSTVDLTRAARISPGNPRSTRVEGGLVRPLGDGSTTLTVQAGGLTGHVPVEVRAAKTPIAWSFGNHVQSVLSRQGCNMGACHGAGAGKGGFRLSLRAYDNEADYERLKVEGRGRRIVKRAPEQSLLLRKPSMGLPHQGGLLLKRDSLEYRVLAEWIAAGAKGPAPKDPVITRLEVFPTERSLRPGEEQQLLVTARFSDGRVEDVTHWAKYASNEEPIAAVDDAGRVRMKRRGETAITVWYLGRSTFARVLAPFNPVGSMPLSTSVRPRGPLTPNSGGAGARSSRAAAARRGLPLSQNWERGSGGEGLVDRHIHAKLRKLGLTPSARAGDAEFIRRVTLDAIGTLPTPEETRAFMADARPDKRERLIDALLERPEYVDYWATRWSDLLRVSRDFLGQKGAALLHAWVRESVRDNKPWDRFARELVTATGSTAEAGPANFYRMGTKPEEFAENISQAFLGIRVQCAHCHNHPAEKWTQSDYYRMTNLFARVGRKEGARGEVIFAARTGDVDHPKLGRPLPPAPFDGPAMSLDDPTDRREALARWMTAPDNPYFARAVVNRVWKYLMGRGLVEPADDMRPTNPASNEPLLAALTKDFAGAGFDLKRLIRQIVRSEAYGRSARANATNALDDRFHSRYLPRRLPAEALLDAMVQVTGAPEKFPGFPTATRAISLPDTRVDSLFLDIFGRPQRQITCECERAADSSMTQALHLINAKTINDKITAPEGTLARLLASGKPDAAVLEELTLACFSRAPSREERRALEDALASALRAAKNEPARKAARAAVFGDLLWAFLSSTEFAYNH